MNQTGWRENQLRIKTLPLCGMVEIPFNGKKLYAPIMKNTRRKLDNTPKIVLQILCKADEKAPLSSHTRQRGKILHRKM
jgi:hypothetical protein